MDSGTLELQIFLSLIVVLATAFVALVCDYLKGSNESLRERNIELRVRQQERQFQQTVQEWSAAAQRWPIRTPVIRTPIKPAEARTVPPAPTPDESKDAFQWPVTEVAKAEPEPPPPAPVAKAEPLPAAFPLPPGMHDHTVLTKHMAASAPFSGVVVSIGINDYATQLEQAGPEGMAALMLSVESMIAGLLRAGVDFGCRSTDDEFLLIFANEKGAEAQRRLAAISERLWNFQLRATSNIAVLFCWGAVEVQGESLADSVASASERMHQTKRNRKMIALQAKPRKLAV
jgi:hypothetical protein